MATETLSNGVYCNNNAVFYIKDGKIIMKLMGSFYKTTMNFVMGVTKIDELKPELIKAFDEAYEHAPNW